MKTGLERVQADAAARGIPVEFIARSAIDPNTADRSNFVKSMVVKRHDGTFLFALIPVPRKISWPKLRTVVGVNKLVLPEASTAFEATGHVRGTITPLGSTTPWPVFIDERLAGRRIGMGSGALDTAVFLDSDTLIRKLTATVADISD